MSLRFHCNAAVLTVFILVVGCCTWSLAEDSQTSHQLTLADLAAYRAALSGRATADSAAGSDAPKPVNFKDLWSHPDAYRGDRVTIEGRVARIFRQGPVGSFPALAEVWIASPVGDPFCLVMPQDGSTGTLRANDHGERRRLGSSPIPELGQTIRFTGTFLKMVSYPAGDGARLAPLVVGQQPPTPTAKATSSVGAGSLPSAHGVKAGGYPGHRIRWWPLSQSSWALGLILAVVTVGVFAWQYLRAPSRNARQRRLGLRPVASDPDPLLAFIEPRTET
jgi:hypothetical protein